MDFLAESLVIRKLEGSKLTFSKISARKKAPENSRWTFWGKNPLKMGMRCLKILGEAGKQEIFATNVPKIWDPKSSSEQTFFRKLTLGAPECLPLYAEIFHS